MYVPDRHPPQHGEQRATGNDRDSSHGYTWSGVGHRQPIERWPRERPQAYGKRLSFSLERPRFQSQGGGPRSDRCPHPPLPSRRRPLSVVVVQDEGEDVAAGHLAEELPRTWIDNGEGGGAMIRHPLQHIVDGLVGRGKRRTTIQKRADRRSFPAGEPPASRAVRSYPPRRPPKTARR